MKILFITICTLLYVWICKIRWIKQKGNNQQEGNKACNKWQKKPINIKKREKNSSQTLHCMLQTKLHFENSPKWCRGHRLLVWRILVGALRKEVKPFIYQSRNPWFPSSFPFAIDFVDYFGFNPNPNPHSPTGFIQCFISCWNYFLQCVCVWQSLCRFFSCSVKFKLDSCVVRPCCFETPNSLN